MRQLLYCEPQVGYKYIDNVEYTQPEMCACGVKSRQLKSHVVCDYRKHKGMCSGVCRCRVQASVDGRLEAWKDVFYCSASGGHNPGQRLWYPCSFGWET